MHRQALGWRRNFRHLLAIPFPPHLWGASATLALDSSSEMADTREDVVGWTRGQNAVRKPSQASLSQSQTCFQDNRWMSCHLLCWKKPMRWPNPVVDVMWKTGTLGSSQTTSSLFTRLVGYLKGGYYAFPCGNMHILANENNLAYEAKCLCKSLPTQTWFSLMFLCGWKYILYVNFVLNVLSF